MVQTSNGPQCDYSSGLAQEQRGCDAPVRPGRTAAPELEAVSAPSHLVPRFLRERPRRTIGESMSASIPPTIALQTVYVIATNSQNHG